MTIRNPQGRDDLIWLDEAIITYDRPHAWFTEHIANGELHPEQLPADIRVYLHKHEIEPLVLWTDNNDPGTLDDPAALEQDSFIEADQGLGE